MELQPVSLDSFDTKIGYSIKLFSGILNIISKTIFTSFIVFNISKYIIFFIHWYRRCSFFLMFVIQRDRNQILTQIHYVLARHKNTVQICCPLGRSFKIIKQKPWKSKRLIRFSFSHVKGSSGSKCCNTFCLDVLLVILSCLCILLWWWMFRALNKAVYTYIHRYVCNRHFFLFLVHSLSENIFFW